MLGPKLFWTAVREDPAPEVFRSDLWGLIHYGYVGRAHGIEEWMLRTGNRWFGGVQGDDDDLALEIGMRLWRNVGYALTRSATGSSQIGAGLFEDMVACVCLLTEAPPSTRSGEADHQPKRFA